MWRMDAGSVELLSSITWCSSSHTFSGSTTGCPMALTSQLATVLKNTHGVGVICSDTPRRWITQPYTAQNSCCGSRIEARALRFSYFQFRSFKHWTGHRTRRRIDCEYVRARVTSVWGQRWKKKRKGESERGEEWLREERWMLCQHVVLMQLVWVTLSHLCASCKSSQSFGRLATEEDSTAVMLKAGSTSIGNLIESCSHADLIKVLCSWIVGTVRHRNSLCVALHGSLSTRLSKELYGPYNFY